MKQSEKENNNLIPFRIQKLKDKNIKKYRYELAKLNFSHYKGKKNVRYPNYNFLTEEAIKNKSYRNFLNPYNAWKSKTVLNFEFFGRNSGKTKNKIRMFFAFFYHDNKSRAIWLGRFETSSTKSLINSFYSQMIEAGIDTSFFSVKSNGVYFISSESKKIKIIEFRSIGSVDSNRFTSFNPLNLKMILMDELILVSGEYISNEVTKLIDIIQTILRLKKNDKSFKIFFLSNNIAENSPYHYYFKLPKVDNYEKGKYVRLNKFIDYTFFSSKKEPNFAVKKSFAYNLTIGILGEENYAFNNIPIIQNSVLFNKIPQNYKYKFNIILETEELGIIIVGCFFSKEDNKYLISRKKNKNGKVITLSLFFSNKGKFLNKNQIDELKHAVIERRLLIEDDQLLEIFIKNLKTAEYNEKYYKIKLKLL